jgi:hypothetical protein
MRLFPALLCGLSVCLLPVSCRLDTKMEKALQNASAYIEARGDRLLPMMIPTLHHLQQTYGLRIDLARQEEEIRRLNKSRRNPFLRELDPETPISAEDIRKLAGIDRITAAALHCDRFGLPENFLDKVHRLALQGKYALTHATLALLLAGWRKCLPNGKEFQDELSFQYGKLVQLSRSVEPRSDLGVETILMLLLAGRNLEPKPDFDRSLLVQMLGGQSQDGSWNGDDHTTVLAMWVLLEARRQALADRVIFHD